MNFKQESVLLAETSERLGVELFHDLHTFDCKENPERRFARKATNRAGRSPSTCTRGAKPSRRIKRKHPDDLVEMPACW